MSWGPLGFTPSFGSCIWFWLNWGLSGCYDYSGWDFCRAGHFINGVLAFWNQITAIPTLGVVAWLAACSSKPQDFTLRWSRVPGLRTWPSFINYSANSAGNADELNSDLAPWSRGANLALDPTSPLTLCPLVIIKLYRNSTVIVIQCLLYASHCVRLWVF